MTVQPNEDETTSWSLAKHMHHGIFALGAIEQDARNDQPHPVCHHFWANTDSDKEFEEVISGRRYANLESEFEEMGLTFEADRLEAWETVSPTENWLNSRIPALFEFAIEKGLGGYQGWTWEPQLGQPVGASELQVINKRSGETD